MTSNSSVVLHSMNESVSNFISYDEGYSLIYENILLALFLILLDFMTIMGNSFVIMAIVFDLNLRSPTHYLMGSLASADLLIGLCILPFSSFQMYFNHWPFGEAFCTIWKSTSFQQSFVCLFFVQYELLKSFTFKRLMFYAAPQAFTFCWQFLWIAISVWRGPSATVVF